MSTHEIDWADIQYRLSKRLQDRSGLPQAKAENIAEYVTEMFRMEFRKVAINLEQRIEVD